MYSYTHDSFFMYFRLFSLLFCFAFTLVLSCSTCVTDGRTDGRRESRFPRPRCGASIRHSNTVATSRGKNLLTYCLVKYFGIVDNAVDNSFVGFDFTRYQNNGKHYMCKYDVRRFILEVYGLTRGRLTVSFRKTWLPSRAVRARYNHCLVLVSCSVQLSYHRRQLQIAFRNLWAKTSFRIFPVMKTGYVSWDCGLWMKEGTEPTWSSYLKR